MCKWGTDTIIHVIQRNNEFIPRGWHPIGVDSCIAELVQLMNFQGIITSLCCCGHGEHPGKIYAEPESIPLLDKWGYQWLCPKDDPDNDDPWQKTREDIVIIKLPLIEKTWDE